MGIAPLTQVNTNVCQSLVRHEPLWVQQPGCLRSVLVCSKLRLTHYITCIDIMVFLYVYVGAYCLRSMYVSLLKL